MRARRSIPRSAVWSVAGAIAVAACGSAEPSGTAAGSIDVATPTTSPATSPAVTETTGPTSSSTPTTARPQPGADTSPPAATIDEPAGDPADRPAGAGCSVDNAPTTAAAADGSAPVIAVRAESIGNPLPDLAVRLVNCEGGWVNLKNELPADRPLLVWFWAPH
jgi:hypothetical protein